MACIAMMEKTEGLPELNTGIETISRIKIKHFCELGKEFINFIYETFGAGFEKNFEVNKVYSTLSVRVESHIGN